MRVCVCGVSLTDRCRQLDGFRILSYRSFTSAANPSNDSSAVTLAGLINTPWEGAQLKYLWPLTVPSFLPLGRSSPTPYLQTSDRASVVDVLLHAQTPNARIKQHRTCRLG